MGSPAAHRQRLTITGQSSLLHAHQPLPVFYWIIPAIQSALVVASALTGVTLTVQFRVVRRVENPRPRPRRRESGTHKIC
jgi:hypothetical protein